MRDIAHFDVDYTGYLSHELEAVEPLPDFAQDPAQLLEAYRAMTLARAFDHKAVSLQRTGRLGTFASCLGEEAVAVAVGLAMHAEDVLAPMYRHHAAHLNRGGRMEELFLYWGGDERGMDYATPREDLPIAVPIGTQATHAAGVAYAFKYRHQPRVAVCLIGDGGTSRGDFYEAINAAGIWQLPVVFMVCNNQWAISVPRARQSRAETLAQKAIAAGIPGGQVDGNDYIAVRDRLDVALERARQDNGPAVIEALTYRMSDHTTADDARRYRPDEQLAAWQARDPVERLRGYLVRIGAWRDDDQQALESECREAVDAAADAYLASEPQPAEAMFDYLHAELPAALAAQRASLADDEEAADD